MFELNENSDKTLDEESIPEEEVEIDLNQMGSF